ncbi:MAG: Na+/H+ antiporter NhaA [Rhodobacteraceae bacterium]|nr:Na+/H+ antiporter NhaA [Paracoccaceae bacterium]
MTWTFITRYSILLITGALIALIWANISPEHYHSVVEFVLIEHSPIGHLHIDALGHSSRTLTLHYLVNDILMAFFFAVAGKEVWEAVALKGGALRGKKALTPLFATAGGMFGPIAIYLGLAAMFGSTTYSAVANGWAIPTATDIAFSYLIGRMVFGAGHPAVRFLLLLAIADDAAGLLILAVFYPSAELAPSWLLLSLAGVLAIYFLFNWLPLRLDRGNPNKPVSSMVLKRFHFWPYALAGIASWYGFQEAGIHPALGLLPVIPIIPHADRDFGIIVPEDHHPKDLLNVIEHHLIIPVDIILFFFGLANAGVVFSAFGIPTVLVLAGLIVGKPVGIFLFGWIAASVFRFGVPEGMRLIDILVLGFIAAIGFTVSLFVASVAFDPGPVQDAAKMGALLSLGAAAISIYAGILFRVEKQE